MGQAMSEFCYELISEVKRLKNKLERENRK